MNNKLKIITSVLGGLLGLGVLALAGRKIINRAEDDGLDILKYDTDEVENSEDSE